MYLAHYKLKENPFQKTLNPRYLWRRKNHREILSDLDKTISKTNGFTVLTGDVGAGKTTLVNAWIEHLGEETIVVSAEFLEYEENMLVGYLKTFV